MTAPDDPAIRALRQTRLLSGLSVAHLAQLLSAARRIEVEQGMHLITEGAVADDLYLVLRGRFTVRTRGHAIADIGAGEPIGEIAFFAGGLRSADVVAARSGTVLALGRAQWDRLAQNVPQINQAIMASLARRLAETSRTAPPMRPLAPRSVAFLGDVPDAVVSALAVGLEGWAVVWGGHARDPLAELHRLEAAGQRVLLIAPPDSLLGEVDEIFDFAPLARPPDLSAPALRRPGAGAPVSLVLWRAARGTAISGTALWLTRRQPHRHLHIALDAPEQIARLLRFIEGRALGLVLSGGGAQGTAHLGALKALGEHGLTFDMVGGTSAGAAMGAALALGRHPDEVMALCEDVFLRSRAMGRYTLPRYSVLDPTLFDAALRKHFGAHEIEDLPLPFFAVATNLSRNDVALLDQGPLWQAVRASTSIPAVFPPWVTEAGDILVDGAMIDNAPIKAMQARKPGPALLLNLVRDTHWPSGAPYDSLPGRAAVLWQVLTVPLRHRTTRDGFPSAIAVLARVFNVNAQRRLRALDARGDVIVDIQPLAGMAFLDWTKARAQFDDTHRVFAAALERAAQAGHSAARPVAFLEAMKAELRWPDRDDAAS